MSFTNTRYDQCATNYNNYENNKIFQRMTDTQDKHSNCSGATSQQGWGSQRAPSLNLIDTESYLTNRNLRMSSCPMYKLNAANCSGEQGNTCEGPRTNIITKTSDACDPLMEKDFFTTLIFHDLPFGGNRRNYATIPRNTRNEARAHYALENCQNNN
jgi:hypothetical protein